MNSKILIAEDNLYTIQQYKTILEKNGYDVTITYDGQECIQKYNEELKKNETNSYNSNPFEIVLIDNNMPKKKWSRGC